MSDISELEQKLTDEWIAQRVHLDFTNFLLHKILQMHQRTPKFRCSMVWNDKQCILGEGHVDHWFEDVIG